MSFTGFGGGEGVHKNWTDKGRADKNCLNISHFAAANVVITKVSISPTGTICRNQIYIARPDPRLLTCHWLCFRKAAASEMYRCVWRKDD